MSERTTTPLLVAMKSGLSIIESACGRGSRCASRRRFVTFAFGSIAQGAPFVIVAASLEQGPRRISGLVCGGRRRPACPVSGVLAGGWCSCRSPPGTPRVRGHRCGPRELSLSPWRSLVGALGAGRLAGGAPLPARGLRHAGISGTHAGGPPCGATRGARPGEHGCCRTRIGGLLCRTRTRWAPPSRRHRCSGIAPGVCRDDADLGRVGLVAPDLRRGEEALRLVARSADSDGRTLPLRFPDPPGRSWRCSAST